MKSARRKSGRIFAGATVAHRKTAAADSMGPDLHRSDVIGTARLAMRRTSPFRRIVMNSVSARRLLWIALGGLGILGAVWDTVWHSRHAGSELASASERLEAHWLVIFGVLVIFVALSLAVRSVRQPLSAVASTWIAFVGSLSMVIGFAWDSTCHIQGTESPGGHVLIYAGLLLVIVGASCRTGFQP
jgi:hypothetical protein